MRIGTGLLEQVSGMEWEACLVASPNTIDAVGMQANLVFILQLWGLMGLVDSITIVNTTGGRVNSIIFEAFAIYINRYFYIMNEWVVLQ